MSEKVWRVVTSYLEMKEYSKCVINNSKLPGSKIEPRSKTFDEKEHKSLCADLKYLYTAVTRAKCNLWIYDSDKTKRLPMFDYWHKRGLVKVVSTTESGESKHDLIFASISTTEQWKVQGDYFRRKHLWEQAQHCYEKSGQENAHLAKQANAYLLIQRARAQLNPTLFRDAAICLLECDQLRHDVKCLSSAAVCLRKTKPPRHVDAAKLFEKLGDIHHAFFAYKKGKDLDNCVRLLEQTHDYNRALKILSENSKRKALAKAAEYESWGIELNKEFTTREFSFYCASLYAKRKETALLLEVLQYMPESEKRIRFMKEAELFEEAFDDYVKEKHYKEAYRLACAQGWHHKGILLAKQQNDSKTVASFILQKAITEYGRQIPEGNLKQMQANSELLNELHSLTKSEDGYIKAQALLLLGIFKEDAGFCRKAQEIFKLASLRHKVGEVEAFRAVVHLDITRNESIRSVLDACHSAREAGNSLMNASHLSQVVQHAAEFYNLQRIGDVYHMPKGQDVWICKLDPKCICKDRSEDLDGMLRLDVSSTRDLMANHCNSFVEKWLQDFQLSQKLVSKLNSFTVHKEIKEKRFLSHQYSAAEVSAVALQEYLQTCIYLLELCLLSQKLDTAEIRKLIFSVFSPQVSIYLPLSKKHVTIVRNSVKANEEFHRWIKYTIPEQTEHRDKIRFDPWLTAWRACCITVGEPTALSSIIEKETDKINAEYEKFKNCQKQSSKSTEVSERKKTDSQNTSAKPQKKQADKKSASEQSQVNQDPPTEFQAPETFILWRNEDRYYHIFFFWLQSCSLIKEEGKVLWASKCAIYHFLGNIARSRSVAVSVMNMVDILSIHCTAIMVMLTRLNALQKRAPFNFMVPLLYQHAIQVFDDLNICRRGHKWISTACKEEVERATIRRNGLLFVRQDCIKLLWHSLDLLLGKYSPWFNVFKFSLNTAAATHCLILTLSIFGNLVLTGSKPNEEIEGYQRKISGILQKAAKPEYHPKYIDDSFQSSISPDFPHNVFSLVDRLLLLGSSPSASATLARLQFIPTTSKVDFVAIPKQHQAPIKQQAQQLTVSQQPLVNQWPLVGQQQAQQPPISQQPQPPVRQQPPYQPTRSYASSVTVPQPSESTPQALGLHSTPRPPPPLDYSHSMGSPSYVQGQLPEIYSQGQLPIQQPRSPPGFMSPGPVAALAGISPTIHPIYKQFPLAPQPRFAPTPAPPHQSTFSGEHDHVPGTQPPHTAGQYLQQPPFSYSSQHGATPGTQTPQVEGQHFQQLAHATLSHPTGAIHVGELQSPYYPGSESSAAPDFQTAESTASAVENYSQVSSPWHSMNKQPDTAETEREQTEAEVIDYEQDEVLSQAFVGQDLKKEEVKDQIDPEMIDPTLVEGNVCNVCSVMLRVEPAYDLEDEDESEGTPKVESDICTESYWVHVHSEVHQTNVKLYKKYISEYELHYCPLMGDLNKIRDQCQSAHVPSLARTINDITVEIERNEWRMANIGRNWEQGIREMSEMCDRVHVLLNHASQEYEKVVLTDLEANVLDIHGEQDEKAYIEDIEGEIDSDMELDEHLASGTDVSVTARTEEEKYQARDRKRDRRKNRGGGK